MKEVFGKMSQKGRQQKLNETVAFLKEKGGKATFNEAFSHVHTKYAVSQNTFWNYLSDLRLAGKIEYNDMYIAGNAGDVKIILKS
jgi:hypothetical protein